MNSRKSITEGQLALLKRTRVAGDKGEGGSESRVVVGDQGLLETMVVLKGRSCRCHWTGIS